MKIYLEYRSSLSICFTMQVCNNNGCFLFMDDAIDYGYVNQNVLNMLK